MALISLMVLLNNLTYLLAKPNKLTISEADQVRWLRSQFKDMLTFMVNSQNIKVHLDDERLKLFDKIDDLAHEADEPPYIDHLRFRVEELINRIRICERNDCASFHKPIQAPSLFTKEDEDVKPIGLEKHSERLVKRLIYNEKRRIHETIWDPSKLEFTAITGEGGTGKTTLANIVYNDVWVTRHFVCRAWITVSRDYRLRNLLLDILNHIMVITEEIYNMEERKLKKKILGQLQHRRYLIVMDDVWTTEVWDELKDVFRDNKLGSRVVLTTRCPNMLHLILEAYDRENEYTGSQFVLPRKRGLVRKVIFGDQKYPYHIEDILRSIEDGCMGWPIASMVAGSILKTSKDAKHIWPRLSERLVFFHLYPHVPRLHSEDEVLGILSLCYEEMPQHLKTCFLYLSVFPEDLEISVKQLIQLWIAEGLIRWEEQEEEEEEEEDARPAGSMEDVAQDYLRELVSLKLVQVTKRRSNGDAKSIRVHDLIRELCISLSWDEIFVEVYGHPRRRKLWKLPIWGTLATESGVQILQRRYNIKWVGSYECGCERGSHTLPHQRKFFRRRLLLLHPHLLAVFTPKSKVFKLWIPKNRSTQSRPWVLSIIRSCATYIKEKEKETSNYNSSHIRSFSCFSHDDARSVSGEDWASLLQKFPSLRVLNLGLEEVGILPSEAIQHLTRLRYIKVRPGVTKSVFKLWNLQTIDLRTSRFGELPKDIWKLQHLRHLYMDGPSRLPVADEADDQDGCCLPNLLTLSYISVDRADEISKKTPNLKKLGLYAYECFSLDEQESTFNLPQLQSLKFAHKCTFEVPIKFPTTITKISVKKARLEPTAVEMFGELPNLQILKLVQTIFRDDELVFGEDSFPQLQVLKIEESNLVSWKLEKGAIQKLRRLVFVKCRLLSEPQPGLLQQLTSLQELEFIWTNRTFVEKLNDEARELKRERLKIKVHNMLHHDAKA